MFAHCAPNSEQEYEQHSLKTIVALSVIWPDKESINLNEFYQQKNIIIVTGLLATKIQVPFNVWRWHHKTTCWYNLNLLKHVYSTKYDK